MEPIQKLAALVFVLLVLGNEVTMSNSQTICNMSQEGLMACKPSVTAPNPSPPSTMCCSALSGADMHCLCSYKNSNMLPSLGIDPQLALQLPAKCNLPQPTNC
uniref:Bifunctional inhibitor/plant lipid transfer protein/seed storage helical domain-containing protein n=1 Tax=Nelumbo nucifera TaxID=4432 RepID=A0A822XV19_NELNU|nr:TPA_asm: hypothetical protein HUJ06_025663 [Nelumbo nucifera]